MKQTLEKFLKSQTLRFLIAGGVNTGFSYFCFAVMMYIIGSKEVVLTLSTIICVLFNYFTSSKFVFRDKDGVNLKKIVKFYGIYFVTYILNLIHLRVTVDMLGWNVYWAQLCTLLYMPWISFFLQRILLFKNK